MEKTFSVESNVINYFFCRDNVNTVTDNNVDVLVC